MKLKRIKLTKNQIFSSRLSKWGFKYFSMSLSVKEVSSISEISNKSVFGMLTAMQNVSINVKKNTVNY